MNVSRLVNLGVAVVISAIQWTAFLSPRPYAQSVQVVGTPVADSASEDSMPVVVVTAHRRS
jgi:hypothetical protein